MSDPCNKLSPRKQRGLELLLAGLTVEEALEAEFSVLELKHAGVQPPELVAAGVAVERLRSVGYSARELRRLGFTAQALNPHRRLAFNPEASARVAAASPAGASPAKASALLQREKALCEALGISCPQHYQT